MDGWIATGVCSHGSGVIPPAPAASPKLKSSSEIQLEFRLPAPQRKASSKTCLGLHVGQCRSQDGPLVGPVDPKMADVGPGRSQDGLHVSPCWSQDDSDVSPCCPQDSLMLAHVDSRDSLMLAMTRVPSPKRCCPLRAGGMLSKTVVVPRKLALSQSCTGTPQPGRQNHPTPTCYLSHSPSHGSEPAALKDVMANTRRDCITSVRAGRDGPSRKTFLPGRGNGRGL